MAWQLFPFAASESDDCEEVSCSVFERFGNALALSKSFVDGFNNVPGATTTGLDKGADTFAWR